MRCRGSRRVLEPCRLRCYLDSCGPAGISLCSSSPAGRACRCGATVLVLIGVSVIMTWCVNIARFSVLTAVVMHGAFNTVSRFLNVFFAAPSRVPASRLSWSSDVWVPRSRRSCRHYARTSLHIGRHT
jgi:hypothetical protein